MVTSRADDVGDIRGSHTWSCPYQMLFQHVTGLECIILEIPNQLRESAFCAFESTCGDLNGSNARNAACSFIIILFSTHVGPSIFEIAA